MHINDVVPLPIARYSAAASVLFASSISSLHGDAVVVVRVSV